MSIKGRVLETVLFVDDESNYLAYITSIFEERGQRILTARSAMDALKLVGEQPVAMVVSDNVMPGMGGASRRPDRPAARRVVGSIGRDAARDQIRQLAS